MIDLAHAFLSCYQVTLRATKTYISNGQTITLRLENITHTKNDTLSLRVTNLTPYTDYTAIVQSWTIELGESSDPVTVRTLAAHPPPLPQPRLPVTNTIKNNPFLAATPESFSVYLFPGSTINGPIRWARTDSPLMLSTVYI